MVNTASPPMRSASSRGFPYRNHPTGWFHVGWSAEFDANEAIGQIAPAMKNHMEQGQQTMAVVVQAFTEAVKALTGVASSMEHAAEVMAAPSDQPWFWLMNRHQHKPPKIWHVPLPGSRGGLSYRRPGLRQVYF